MGLEEQDWNALFWGCISAVSFPLGATIGITIHIPTKLLVSLMSFGAGALLFALSIELFGGAMQEMAEGKIGKAEVICSMTSAVAGALSFIVMNRFLGEHEVNGGEDTAEQMPAEAVHVPLYDMQDEEPNPGSSDPALPMRSVGQPGLGSTPHHALSGNPCNDWEQSASRGRRHSQQTSPDLRIDTAWFSNLRVVGSPASPLHTGRRHSIGECTTPRASPVVRSETSAPRSTIANVSTSTRPLALAAGLWMAGESTEDNCWLPMTDRDDSDEGDPSTESEHLPPASAGGGAAMAIWLGLTMDGVPEAVVIGILANRDAMSMALIVGVFLANFPEAIATAALMRRSGMHGAKILGLWASLCLMTGAVAMIAAIVFPKKQEHWLGFVTTGSEGLAAGAMLAMISGTMLPDAYKQGGSDLVGFWAVMGFLSVLWVRVMWPAMPESPTSGLPNNNNHGDSP